MCGITYIIQNGFFIFGLIPKYSFGNFSRSRRCCAVKFWGAQNLAEILRSAKLERTIPSESRDIAKRRFNNILQKKRPFCSSSIVMSFSPKPDFLNHCGPHQRFPKGCFRRIRDFFCTPVFRTKCRTEKLSKQPPMWYLPP